MNVFLDTNILLDLLLEREGYEDAAVLFQLQDEGRVTLHVSILTMVNLAFVYQKTVGQHMAVVNLKYLSSLVKVLPMDAAQMDQALMMDGPDFEDTLQAVCAASGNCDVIVTRNVKDFRIKKGLGKQIVLPVLHTPRSFPVRSEIIRW